MSLGVLQIADVHVALVELAEGATVAVVDLRLGGARDHEELIARGAPTQRVDGVTIVRGDLSERAKVAAHAVEVVHLDGVVVGAGQEPRTCVLEVQRAHNLRVALHGRLVGEREVVVVLLHVRVVV